MTASGPFPGTRGGGGGGVSSAGRVYSLKLHENVKNEDERLYITHARYILYIYILFKRMKYDHPRTIKN